MTARGPAWEGDPAAARLGYDPQTAPLPHGVTSGDPYRDTAPYPDQDQDPGGYGPVDYGPEGDGWGRTRGRRPGRGRRLLRRLAAGLIALVVLAGVAFGLLYLATPSVQNAPALARAIDRAHHVRYPGPPVPALFAESLVATEDHRFYSEPGIDVFAVARVAAATLTGHGAAQGGATLYQQLAKMLYTPGASGVATEVEQVMLGIKLDQAFSKAQIMRMYSDVAYFGHGYYGLAAASCGYFGTQRPASRYPRRPRWLAWSRARPRTTRSTTTRGAGPGRRTCWTGWSPPGRSPLRSPRGPTPEACIWSAAPGEAARPNRLRSSRTRTLNAIDWPVACSCPGCPGGGAGRPTGHRSRGPHAGRPWCAR